MRKTESSSKKSNFRKQMDTLSSMDSLPKAHSPSSGGLSGGGASKTDFPAGLTHGTTHQLCVSHTRQVQSQGLGLDLLKCSVSFLLGLLMICLTTSRYRVSMNWEHFSTEQNGIKWCQSRVSGPLMFQRPCGAAAILLSLSQSWKFPLTEVVLGILHPSCSWAIKVPSILRNACHGKLSHQHCEEKCLLHLPKVHKKTR